MPRPKRADEANGIYHALNRGNARSAIFKKDADYNAFEQILSEGLERYPCNILSYQLMPNHWHFVLQPTEDGGMSDFLRWVTLTHTQRYHAHYGSSGQGHVYQGRFKSFPVRWSVKRGSPFGNETWVESTARRLDLESTLRPRGRPRVHRSPNNDS